MENLSKVLKKTISKLPSFYIILNNNLDLKTALINLKAFKSIEKNHLFDTAYYLKNNQDIKTSEINPLLHYIYHGYKEGRNPNPTFNSEYYLKKYEDVNNSNLNPLVHYSLYGLSEGRCTTSCKKLFEKEFKHLQKSVKGKNGYLFLINDSNNEIKQHFDKNYENNFNPTIFVKDLSLKKKFCNEKNIKYFFFIVPDKSLVCKDFLPFKPELIKRNYESIKRHIPDFSIHLDQNHYFENDSHINYLGAKELIYHYLNHMDNTFNKEDYNNLLNNQISVLHLKGDGDLTEKNNWSYSEEEKTEHINKDITVLKNKSLINLDHYIPEKFKYCGERKTEYYKNENGFKDLKVLVFRASSLIYLKDVLSIYFKEILLYWDHWHFNKELIEWYKPDIILEIRTERFLENYPSYEKLN